MNLYTFSLFAHPSIPVLTIQKSANVGMYVIEHAPSSLQTINFEMLPLFVYLGVFRGAVLGPYE